MQLAAVDQRQGETVGKGCAQFLLQVQCKAWTVGPVTVQGTYCGIEAHGFGGRLAVMGGKGYRKENSAFIASKGERAVQRSSGSGLRIR